MTSNTLIKMICIAALGIFISGLKAQPFNINLIKAHANWGFDGNDRVVFESHSMRPIARYDSFPSVLTDFFEDIEKSNLDLDSMTLPIQMHYIKFKDGKRKLTIENPEYIAKEYDLDKEIENNNDSLPGNLIEIYDAKHQVKMKIYVEHPSNLKKLKSMAIDYRDSIYPLSQKGKQLLIHQLNEHPIIYFKSLYLNYFNFCKDLKELIEPEERQTTYNTYIPAASYEFNEKKIRERTSYSFESPFEELFWFHHGWGLMNNNICLQQNLEISLYTYFKNDLPALKLYSNCGIFGFTEKQYTNSNELKINGFYETLFGIKTNNINPKMKSEKELRVSGFEFGLFFKDASSNSTLLPTSGYAGKIYTQWGNFRFNTGIYKSKTSIAALMSIEIYDVFKTVNERK